MDDRAYNGHAEASPRSSEADPSITTFAGLKKETHTAVVQYFAPVVALYNVVATTAGLPTVRWQTRSETEPTDQRGSLWNGAYRHWATTNVTPASPPAA
jgi:hypothetical protein